MTRPLSVSKTIRSVESAGEAGLTMRYSAPGTYLCGLVVTAGPYASLTRVDGSPTPTLASVRAPLLSTSTLATTPPLSITDTPRGAAGSRTYAQVAALSGGGVASPAALRSSAAVMPTRTGPIPAGVTVQSPAVVGGLATPESELAAGAVCVDGAESTADPSLRSTLHPAEEMKTAAPSPTTLRTCSSASVASRPLRSRVLCLGEVSCSS